MRKTIQSIITKGLVIYLITIAVCFKMWDMYVSYNVDHYNYICNGNDKLFKSATPGSQVFIKQNHETCLNGE